MSRGTRTAVRCVAAGQGAIGAVLLLRPALVPATRTDPAAATASPPAAGEHRPVPRWLVRLLGARMAAQAVLEVSSPTPFVSGAGAAVDALHATSMVAVAVAGPTYRRPAIGSAAVAGASAAALATLARLAATRPR